MFLRVDTLRFASPVAMFAMLLACSDGKEEAGGSGTKAARTESGKAPLLQASQPLPVDAGKIPSPVKKAEFSDGTRGLRLKRSIVVRAEPSLEGEKLGTVAAHTIVGWNEQVVAPGCEGRWISIEPKGWVCDAYLEPMPRFPGGTELPKLRGAERVPGSYGKVIGPDAVVVTLRKGKIISESPILGASTVRKRGMETIDGEVYWKIDGGKYILQSSLKLHKPSEYQGKRLQGSSGMDLPVAFAYSGNRPGDWVGIWDGHGKQVRRVRPRTVLPVLGTKKNSSGKVTHYNLGEGEFLLARDARVVNKQEPPPTTGKWERWFDIDLASQVLVAYEGALPVYATLISSGTRKNPTETGIFRIWIKFSETTMSGRMGESDAYSVATVPWTQFYENDFALHTSYWHDRFGQQRSHGCINLSPRDARFVYFWSDPQVPKGWSMANGTTDSPGSMVRVHSKADPNPEFKGRGKRVYEQRLADPS